MISVIIPAKDAAKTIGECIQALLQQEGFQYDQDYEVIVVDDGSNDDTAAMTEKFGVRVIRQSHAGPAAARNAGAKNARGELLAFTDADCAPSSSWLRNLTQPFDDPEVVGVKGTYRTLQHALVARFVQVEYEYKYARMKQKSSTDFIDTYSAAYRKEVFLLNGGFDETFPMSSVEDQELSFRLARKGYRMVFKPNAVVVHQHDRTLNEYLQRKFGIGYWKAFMLRWIPEKTFSDSHTAPTQRIEIALLALLLLSIPFIAFWPLYAIIAFVTLLIVFFLVTLPFITFIQSQDPEVMWLAPGMLLGRAGALGSGLIKGFILPQKSAPKEFPCQLMGVRFLKRLFDIVGGGLGLVLSSPITVCAAVAIQLDNHGPIFYKQERAGENGKPFTMFKLRTMIDGANQMVDMPDKNSLNNPAFKIQDDPRLTRVGRFLRRWRVDEFPQFWNVLKGDMSLVGPQPEETRVVKLYNDYQRQRLMVKPGITGPIQVSGQGRLNFDRRLQLEIDYLRNYSLLKDIRIIFKTFSALFSGEALY